MEAKDTVMGDEEVIDAYYGYTIHRVACITEKTRLPRRRIAQAQAEISFKAGIGEVVEWIIANKGLGHTMDSCFHITDKRWQSKLKEWGVNLPPQ